MTLRDEIADFRNANPAVPCVTGHSGFHQKLARARRAVPEGDWLKYYEVNARTNAHRFAWMPAEPRDILAFSSSEDPHVLPNRMRDFVIALFIALVPSLLLSNRFTFLENLGIGVTIALSALLLFQMRIGRRSTWFSLLVIAFFSALVIEVAHFIFQLGK